MWAAEINAFQQFVQSYKYRSSDLDRVQEVWSLVSKLLSLFLVHALNQVIPISCQSCRIFPAQEESHQTAATKEADNHVSHDCCVADGEFWRLIEDVAANNAIEVTPANDESEHDTTLVDTLDIVAHPGDRVGDARIDTESSKERACIFDMWLLRGELHREPCNAEDGDANIAETPLLGSIGNETDGDGKDGGTCIWRHGQELGHVGGVSHLLDNCGKEQGEGIEWHIGTHWKFRVSIRPTKEEEEF